MGEPEVLRLRVEQPDGDGAVFEHDSMIAHAERGVDGPNESCPFPSVATSRFLPRITGYSN
jgi:hypothetical protein